MNCNLYYYNKVVTTFDIPHNAINIYVKFLSSSPSNLSIILFATITPNIIPIIPKAITGNNEIVIIELKILKIVV